MPTYIKEIPSKEKLLEDFIVKDGFVYWADKKISRGRASTKSGKRVTTWINDGYYKITFKRQTYQLSRIIYQMTYGDLTVEYEVDHIDRNKLNNKPENLRKVSQAINKRNRPFQKNKTSTKVTGVCLCKKKHPFPYQEKVSEYYVARWYDENGKLIGKNFSVSKHGKEEAFKLACEYRDKMIDELNENGAGYSDTHGK